MIDFENTLIPWIGMTSKLIDCYIMDRFNEEGIELTKVQWVMLNKLKKMDGQPQHSLAFITNRDKASLARLLNTMEKKNLVARIPSKTDQRINHIYITSQGDKMIKMAMPVIKKIMEDLQGGLSEEEVKFSIEVIKRIQKNINNGALEPMQNK